MLDFFKPTALKSDGKSKGLLIVLVLAEFKLCSAYGRRSKQEASKSYNMAMKQAETSTTSTCN